MAIKIKKSHRGLLHENLGVAKGEKIPASKLKIKSSDSPAVKKRKQFAINAKKWHKGQAGTNVRPKPDIIDPKDFMQTPYPTAANPKDFNIAAPHKMSWQPVSEHDRVNWGNVGLDALLALDYIIPERKSVKPVVQPQQSYNQYPYGTGSQAIYKHGGKLPCYGCGGEMEDGGYIQEPQAFVGQYGDNKADDGGVYPFGQFIMPTSKQSVPEFKKGGWIIPMGVPTNEPYTRQTMEYNYGGNLTRDISPSGKIKPQKEVYNPLFEDGGHLRDENRRNPYNYDFGGIIPGISGTMYSRNAYKPNEKITETMMAAAGYVGDPPTKKYTSYEQINKDNAFARDFLTRHHADPYFANQAVVARDVGEPMMKFVHNTPQLGGSTTKLATRLPSGVSVNDVFQTSSGQYGYLDPQYDNFVQVDPQSIYNQYGRTANMPVAKMEDGAMIPYGNYMMEDGGMVEAKGGNWIKGAVNPKHKGYCTPMTKSTCTPRRKAFAMTMKKHHGFHKGEQGLTMENNYYAEGEQYNLTNDEIQHLISNGYDVQLV